MLRSSFGFPASRAFRTEPHRLPIGTSAVVHPGASTNVNILIFDGPLWTLYPLEVSGYTNLSSAAYAISEINGSTPAHVGGYSSYGYYSGTNWIDLSKGGYWSLPSTSFTSQENVVYTGISTSPLNLVGNLGSAARVTRTSGTDFNLPHLANSPSAAWGIVSDASLIVGSSRNNTLLQRLSTIPARSWAMAL
jgi:hypothetical protein